MRKSLAAVASLAAVGLVLTGCAGSGDTPGGNEGGGADQVEVFTWWASGSEKVGLDALVGVFNSQYPDIEFINASVAGGAGSNAKAALASRLEANDPPDSFQAHTGAELTDYIEAGQLQDLSDFYAEQGLTEAFPASLIDRITLDGGIYSVPSNIHRANVTWVNTDLLEAAGVDPNVAPASIEAWIADLDKVQASGVDKPLALGTEWTQVHLFETVLIADLGADGYEGLWDGSTSWDDPGVAAAIDHYGTLLDYANTDFAGLDWDAATQILIDGAAAYNVMGDWAEAAFAQAGWTYGQEYTTWASAGTDGIFDYLADSFTLTVGAPHEEATKSWLSTVSSAEGQKAFNQAKGSIPARIDADAADYGPYQQTALESWANDVVVSSLAHGSAARISWSTDISSAIGRFGSDKDAAVLQAALVDAADKALD